MPVPRDHEDPATAQAQRLALSISSDLSEESDEFKRGVRDAKQTKRRLPRSDNPDYMDGWNSIRQV